jgi:hypothetical protein
MRRILTAALLAFAASNAAYAQEFKPIPNPPITKGVAETLRAAGNFKTFLGLLEKAGLKNLGLEPAGFVGGPGPNRAASDAGVAPASPGGRPGPAQTGPGGGPRYHTVFAPTDAAFAKMKPGALQALTKDPARLRSFLLAHMVSGKVLVADVLTPVGDGTSRTFKELKSRQGQVLGFSCDGHTGLHMPRINGRARVGRFQDVMASDFLVVIHEVDAVLYGDGSV